MARCYRAADLYLHAAHADTFPLAVLEAMACGTPVVGTAVGGIPEQVRSATLAAVRDGAVGDATGVLVPAGGADEMAEAAMAVLGREEPRARLGDNAVARVQAHYTLNRQVDAYLAWYGELIDGAARDPRGRRVMKPLRPGVVSTIIAVYNRPRLLVEAIESVLAQTYRPIEIVIVDDGSTDDTAAVATAYAARHPDVIQYLWQPNGGHPRAMNTGLLAASGEFIQFLDSDDLLLPEKYARQVEGLRAHPECGISYCFAREYAIGGSWSGRPARKTAETFTTLFPEILSGKIWPNPAPLFRRAVVEANGPYCEVSVRSDWEYECRAAARGVRLHHCRAYLSDTRSTHHLEGRRKGGVPRDRLPDLAEVYERILAHARVAGVPASAIDGHSRRLFDAARLCAEAGFEVEARRCLALARGAAGGRLRKARMAVYVAMSNRLGWQTMGRWSRRVGRSRVTRAAGAARRWPAAAYARWRHRAKAALETVSGQPVIAWPHLLGDRWAHRQSRQRLQP